MYFIPYGILVADSIEPGVVGQVATGTLTFEGLMQNPIPVTLGNIVGGTLLVAGIYWFVYLRGADS